MKKGLTLFLISCLLCVAQVTYAAKSWKIIPEKSKLTFTAIQNNSPVTGQFKNFTGDIAFDPKDLNGSHVNIVIDMKSVTTSYGTVADTLKTPEWFDVNKYPQALFAADYIVEDAKAGHNAYMASGKLTIRDKTVPIVVHFVLDQYSDKLAHVKGDTEFARTKFNVGTGEWAKTDAIKDNVKVEFDITAMS